jgi:hypothetical protein
MDSNHPRRLYESRVLPTELASRCSLNRAGRAGFEPAHGVSNSHVPFQLGYRPKCKRPRLLVGAFENSNLNLECYEQTNPEGRTRLTRRLIMDLVRIIIAKVSIAWVSTLPCRIETSYTPVEKIYLHAQRSYGILLDAEEMPNVVSIPIRSERVLNATPRR